MERICVAHGKYNDHTGCLKCEEEAVLEHQYSVPEPDAHLEAEYEARTEYEDMPDDYLFGME